MARQLPLWKPQPEVATSGARISLGFYRSSARLDGREKGFEALFHFSALKTVAIRHG